MWIDETVVIIGGGPSLTMDQLEYVKGRAKTIGINDAYLIAPWIDILYACDLKWWNWHHDRTEALKCLKITPDPAAANRYKDLIYIKGKFAAGLASDRPRSTMAKTADIRRSTWPCIPARKKLF